MAEESSVRQRAPAFKLEIPGDNNVKDAIRHKLVSAKKILSTKLNRMANDADALNAVLDAWLKSETANENASQEHGSESQTSHSQPELVQIQIATRDQAKQPQYVTCKTSLEKLLEISHYHGKSCKSALKISRCTRSGHICRLQLKCDNETVKHSYSWTSSPQLVNGKYAANERIMHGLVFSGMRPSHYARFTRGAGIGCIHQRRRRDHMRSTARLVQSEYEESIETAMLEEQAAYVLLEPEDQPINGIDIMTDARHGHRRNAKDTSVVVLGARTNKVLVHEHVTKTDDPVTQRHELIGTKRIYNHLADNDIHVRVHTHDMNTSVNAWIRNEEPDVTNQNERWHGIKGLKAQVKKVTSGAKKNIGKTWHPELEDKLEPLSTHAYYAIDQCNGNPSALRMSLLNAVEHYKNNHSNCFSTSRCKTDPNYEPSRIVITSQKAEALLVNAIQNLCCIALHRISFLAEKRPMLKVSTTQWTCFTINDHSMGRRSMHSDLILPWCTGMKMLVVLIHLSGKSHTIPPEPVVRNPDGLTRHQRMNIETMYGSAIWIVFIFNSNIAGKRLVFIKNR